MRSVILATGYTAGHINTALAFAQAYRKRWPGDELRFVGARGGVEASLLAGTEWPFFGLTAAPFVDRSLLAQLRNVVALGRGILEARRHLRERPAALVVGFGSYASVGVVAAAVSLGVPTVIHEANAIPGRANRLLGRVVDRIALASPLAGAAFARSQVEVVGVPLREEICALARSSRVAPTGKPPRLLVLGGSLGSRAINAAAPALAAALARRLGALRVLHQAGEQEAATTALAYRALGVDAEVVGYLDDMPAAYRDADYAITAAGAITLAELACAGVPALLVPLREVADDHQAHNAAAFAASTGALVQSSPVWPIDVLADSIARLISAADAWQAAASAMRKAAQVDAAERLVDLCEALTAQPPGA